VIVKRARKVIVVADDQARTSRVRSDCASQRFHDLGHDSRADASELEALRRQGVNMLAV
jgi:hypothetical protein